MATKKWHRCGAILVIQYHVLGTYLFWRLENEGKRANALMSTLADGLTSGCTEVTDTTARQIVKAYLKRASSE